MAKETTIYGIRPLLEAVSSGKELDKVLVQKGLRAEHLRDLLQKLQEHNIPVQQVPAEKLNRLIRGNHQGVVGFISPIEYQDLEALVPMLFESARHPFLLILDRITDVRNFGALARTAECAGVHAMIIPARGSAHPGEDAIRTSSGALLRLPVCRSFNLKNTILYLKNSGIQIVAVTEKATSYLYSVDLRIPTAIILGSEEDGISEAYLKLCDARVRIPMFGKVESLNVSVAGGIILYEVVKQRINITDAVI